MYIRSYDTWVWKIPWRRAWQPTPVSSPGESHGQRSLTSYSPHGYMTESSQQSAAPTQPSNNFCVDVC